VQRLKFDAVPWRADDARPMSPHPLEHLLERPLPDLSLPSSHGGEFRFRQFVDERPLVLFFYIRNSTPG